MTRTITDATRELATLHPMLTTALTRDQPPEHHPGINAPTPVNPDVLHAILTTRRQIPAETRHAAQLVREPWHTRAIPACLRALPRLDNRLWNTTQPDAATHLEHAVTYWLRLVKTALGLRRPDVPLGAPCPYCPDGQLTVAGSERDIRTAPEGHLTLTDWDSPYRVYCDQCNAVWEREQLTLLADILKPAEVTAR